MFLAIEPTEPEFTHHPTFTITTQEDVLIGCWRFLFKVQL